jgi:hypothetical protein
MLQEEALMSINAVDRTPEIVRGRLAVSFHPGAGHGSRYDLTW